MTPGQAVTVAAAGLRPRLAWALGKPGTVLTHYKAGKRVSVQVRRKATVPIRWRTVTLRPTQVS
jgi:hypothetical protein